ncbi:response regulator [Nonomuraea endophytica]|uniref:DNA-binding NarL/FixJ family response regulator n=1 Tax=Nonomuraea endophytica TaxID=714136 RepID=A0A7W8ADA0_9ACTN|nr:response regulator transcription factor [Nonomuraea endophytica]MBB5083075.1 DNA-binding NarL/FixJ family response regulator [Nonomuraea endophytica]
MTDSAGVIRVLLVDDDPMVRGHLRTILGSSREIEVVGEARDGAEAVEEVLRGRPDVVLMDLRMPGVDGVTATREIAALADPPTVIALTTFDSDTHVRAALAAGASGYLVKTTPAEDLLNLIRVAADGHVVMSPIAARRLVTQSERGESARARIEELAEREREVLVCLGEGLTNPEIAQRLFLSETTVKSYVSRLLTKLGLTHRTQAALLAHRAGLLPGDGDPP